MEYLLFLQNIRENTSPIINAFMNEASNFAINNGSLFIMLIVMYVFDKKLGRRICGSYGFNLFISIWLKNIASISRPWIRDSRIIPAEGMKESAQGFSFPSGHTTIAGSLFIPLIVYIKNNIIKIISIIAIIIIGFSRNYIGVHTLEDVVCGLIFSIIGCIIIFKIMDYIEKDEFDENGHTKEKVDNKDIIVFIIIAIIFIIAVIHVQYKSYPSTVSEIEIQDGKKQIVPYGSLMVGYFLGLILERRFVKYNTDAHLFVKIIRVFVGLIVIMFVMNYLSPMVTNVFGKEPGKIVKYGTALFNVTFVIPLIFTFYEKLLKLNKKEK